MRLSLLAPKPASKMTAPSEAVVLLLLSGFEVKRVVGQVRISVNDSCLGDLWHCSSRSRSRVCVCVCVCLCVCVVRVGGRMQFHCLMFLWPEVLSCGFQSHGAAVIWSLGISGRGLQAGVIVSAQWRILTLLECFLNEGSKKAQSKLAWP